jgi:hypothetical protein
MSILQKILHPRVPLFYLLASYAAFILIATLGACTNSESVRRDPTSEKLDPSAAQSSPFKINGKSIDELYISKIDPNATTYDRIDFASWECETNQTHSCIGEKEFIASPGWQACKFLYTETHDAGDTKKAIDQRNWYSNDPESPDRFRGYYAKIEAYGHFYGSGAEVKWENVGIRMIRANLNNEARYAAGCDMPYHD